MVTSTVILRENPDELRLGVHFSLFASLYETG